MLGGRWIFFSRKMRGEVRYLDGSGHKGLADLTIPGNVDDVGDSSSAREELVADVQLSLSIYIHISPSYIFFCFEYKRGATIADFFWSPVVFEKYIGGSVGGGGVRAGVYVCLCMYDFF